MHTWMLLIYKVPNEPTAGRVFVWRKLKKLGAVLLHDAAWALPATAQTREQLEWLVTEIAELAGQATLWESRLTSESAETALVQQFNLAVDGPYQEILSDLDGHDPDLAALSRRYQQVRAIDYFQSPQGRRVRLALTGASKEQQR